MERMRVIGAKEESAPLYMQVPKLPNGLSWTYFLDDLPGRSVTPNV